MAGAKENPVAYLQRMAAYWEYHQTPRTKFLHPTYKTDEEKRIARNALAVKRRKAAKVAT